MRGEAGRYSRSWRVSSLPAAHRSVAQSDRHTDRRDWRQTPAVSARASPSSSPSPSSNCQSSPLVLGLLSLSLYRNRTHLVVTLSRLNTSFHSHNPQALPRRTLSFPSAGVCRSDIISIERLRQAKWVQPFWVAFGGSAGLFPRVSFCLSALFDCSFQTSRVTPSVFHSFDLFRCWIFCLSPYSFSSLPVLLNLLVQNSCVLFPYFLLSFMLLTTLNLPLFTPFSSVLTAYLVCLSIIFCTSKYVFSHFLPPLVNFYTFHASVRCLPVSTFPYLLPLLPLLLCYFPLALLNQLLFCSLLEFPLHLGNRAFPLFLPPSPSLRFLYPFSPL